MYAVYGISGVIASTSAVIALCYMNVCVRVKIESTCIYTRHLKARETIVSSYLIVRTAC